MIFCRPGLIDSDRLSELLSHVIALTPTEFDRVFTTSGVHSSD